MKRMVFGTWLTCVALSLTACAGPRANSNLWPPLVLAVAERDVERVRELLQSGMDPNQSTEYGETALAVAVGVLENVPRRQIRRLEGLGGPPEEDTEVLELLLAYGADPNLETRYSGPPLQIATYQGLTESVRILLANGADPNYRTEMGNTSLLIAAFHCYADIASLLIDSGADLTQKDHRGNTARSEAERKGCDEVVDLIDRQAP